MIQHILRRLAAFWPEKPTRRTTILLWIVAALPFLALGALLVHFTVNAPFWDQWELVPFIQKQRAGMLGLADLFSQHNEHRLFFPRILMLTLATLSDWNTNWEVMANLVLGGLGFLFLFQIIKKTFVNQRIAVVVTALLGLVFFSPVQLENWLWGWQVQWYLTTLGLVIAVWALSTWKAERQWLKLLVAALGAVLSTYSLGSGFFVWIICVPLFIFYRPLRRWLAAWSGLALLAIWGYFHNYSDPGYEPDKLSLLHHPVQFIRYVLTYLASPLSPEYRWAKFVIIFLLAVLVVALVYLWRRTRRELFTTLLPWLCLGLYGLMAALSTAISRVGFGVEQAASSRYTTLSNFFTMMIIVLVAAALAHGIRPPKINRRVVAGASLSLAVLLVLAVGNWVRGALEMRVYSSRMKYVAQCERSAQSAMDPCLKQVYPNQEIVYPKLEYLRSIRYGVQ